MTSVAAASDSRGSDGIAIPVPYQPLCTARVLVVERLDGRPLAGIDARTPADVRAALAPPPASSQQVQIWRAGLRMEAPAVRGPAGRAGTGL